MQHIDKLTTQALTQTTRVGSTHSTTAGPSDREWTARAVNHVIHQLKAIFPAWTAALKTPELEAEARRQWLQGLIENGINSEEKIRAGLARCRSHNSPFLPSVGQFVEWCNEVSEVAAGMPSESSAYRVFCSLYSCHVGQQNWADFHPAIYWVYRQVSQFDWRRMIERDMRREFNDIWADARKMARDGFNFNSCLPAPEEVKAPETVKNCDPEAAERARREMLSMFDIKPKSTRDRTLAEDLTDRSWAE